MWPWIAAFAVMLVATYALAPKPPKGPPSPLLTDIEAPIAQEGAEVPVLFGTRKLRGPNVVWYGDLRTTPIKSKSGGKK